MRQRQKAGVLALLALAAVALMSAAAQAAEGQVSGRVVFDDGSPAGGARIVLNPGGYATTASEDGTFALSVPGGSYTLRASGGNKTSDMAVVVRDGEPTAIVVRIDRGLNPPSGPNVFPFVFLGLSMVGVALGGFYVNKRMAEKGIDVNKSVMGGVGPRKPFRRRKKKASRPPPSP